MNISPYRAILHGTGPGRADRTPHLADYGELIRPSTRRTERAGLPLCAANQSAESFSTVCCAFKDARRMAHVEQEIWGL
jgi:hypothetical protein